MVRLFAAWVNLTSKSFLQRFATHKRAVYFTILFRAYIACRTRPVNSLVKKKSMKKIITFGTYDLLHIGHVRILERAAALGDHLTVGVSCSELNRSKKGRAPVYSTEDRMAIISALSCVDEVFVEKSLEAKGDYIKEFGADVLVMGDDWEGRFDEFKSICSVVYLPRTTGISTSKLIADISDINPTPDSH